MSCVGFEEGKSAVVGTKVTYWLQMIGPLRDGRFRTKFGSPLLSREIRQADPVRSAQEGRQTVETPYGRQPTPGTRRARGGLPMESGGIQAFSSTPSKVRSNPTSSKPTGPSSASSWSAICARAFRSGRVSASIVQSFPRVVLMFAALRDFGNRPV